MISRDQPLMATGKNSIPCNMEPSKTVGSTTILVCFEQAFIFYCSLLCLTPMVMQFVQIAEQEWSVEVCGSRTSKNAIEKVMLAKLLEISTTRNRKKKIQAYSNTLKAPRRLRCPRQLSVQSRFRAIDWLLCRSLTPALLYRINKPSLWEVLKTYLCLFSKISLKNFGTTSTIYPIAFRKPHMTTNW